MKKPIIILGAGGHASVLADVATLLGMNILGFCNPVNASIKGFPEITYLGNDSILNQYPPEQVNLVNGIGAVSVQGNLQRRALFQQFSDGGYLFETLIHPSTVVARSAQINQGAQIMAGAIIQPNARISENVIVNTAASIDHDCIIGHSVHIAPGSILSGNVVIKDNSMVGVGAVIIQGVTVESNVMVRAGRIAVKNIAATLD